MTLARNSKVFQLEDAIRRDLHASLFEMVPEHHFGGGVYVRSAVIPAGVVATGKMHRHETMNILVSGTLKYLAEDGAEEMTGPCVFASPPMTKKAVYAVTDVVLMNVHPTTETDLDEIEAEFIVPEEEALEYARHELLEGH